MLVKENLEMWIPKVLSRVKQENDLQVVERLAPSTFAGGKR